MALIKCYECGKEISDLSDKCVHCGAPILKESLFKENNRVGITEKNIDIDHETTNKTLNLPSFLNKALIKKAIIIFIAYILVVLVFNSFLEGSIKRSITGCYHMHLIPGEKNDSISLCFKPDTVDFNILTSTVVFYPVWSEENVRVEDEFGNLMFFCEFNRNDNNKIQCDSYNKAIGRGIDIWEKNE